MRMPALPALPALPADAPASVVARRLLARLRRDRRGLALLEFALVSPLILIIGLTGTEYANWVITKMQVSQIALQIADNASRMGVAGNSGKTVYESNITETFAGGELQSAALKLGANGRVILSSAEPTDVTAATPTNYIIRWQRCYGTKTGHASIYGLQGQTSTVGIGGTNKVKPQPKSATMFVEVYYVYKPLFTKVVLPSATFDEIASMAVRDQRVVGVAPTPVAGTTAATC
jgi:Flp pilus assembly protein TadG